MNGIKGFTSIEQIRDTYGIDTPKKTNKDTEVNSFQSVLEKAASQETDGLRFSKHASERLAQRDISLSAEQTGRLSDGLKKAEEKDIKNSLVLMDSLAFIVNVPSQTVITALDSNESKEKAFTNIDGAVIV
ncbi:MAG TPA: flagellar protein [Lachnospiraceae bacterium]|jgi:flagellar operon protein|nr:flagellar protein [Lachnospiraceae bacterium]MDD7664747.1 flagellar protein [Lachnospiraceae bacterium]MDY4164925.1 TIGR02530 family flagellar biosynthesis protein [Lachnospiraceae bacterium]HAP03359.1 flagellar protein [Lachnospiraceae bacterium]